MIYRTPTSFVLTAEGNFSNQNSELSRLMPNVLKLLSSFRQYLIVFLQIKWLHLAMTEVQWNSKENIKKMRSLRTRYFYSALTKPFKDNIEKRIQGVDWYYFSHSSMVLWHTEAVFHCSHIAEKYAGSYFKPEMITEEKVLQSSHTDNLYSKVIFLHFCKPGNFLPFHTAYLSYAHL